MTCALAQWLASKAATCPGRNCPARLPRSGARPTLMADLPEQRLRRVASDCWSDVWVRGESGVDREISQR